METKFVSLGSYCEVAHNLSRSGLRLEGYPFDYITTIDSEGLLKMLEEDFEFFLDDKYLTTSPRDPDHPLYNNYYKMEFLHEGDFNIENKEVYDTNLKIFKERYTRKIDRFRNLKYKEKVIFIRHARYYEPRREYHDKENEYISDDYAIRLYNTLSSYFKELNFKLIIINKYDDNCDLTDKTISEEKRINDNLIIAKSNINLDDTQKSDMYKKYLLNLQ